MMLTIAEAVLVTGRTKSTIYRWIEAGKIDATRGTDGIRRVDGQTLLQVEADARPGRPARQHTPAERAAIHAAFHEYADALEANRGSAIVCNVDDYVRDIRDWANETHGVSR